MNELIIFLGRLHPLIIHFPIALIICVFLIEFWGIKRYPYLKQALPFLLAIASISAILACIFGWIWGEESSYQGQNAIYLWRHRWLGISTASFCLFSFILSLKYLPEDKNMNRWKNLFRGNLIIATLLVMITGHLGGMMIHGDDHYNVWAEEKKTSLDKPQVTTKKIDFKSQIEPIFKRSCAKKCHTPEKKKGELRLDKNKYALLGGENGPALVPGNKEKSLLYKRITLPHDHEDYMPSKGDPLTQAEVEIIGLWIDQGAPWPED